MWILLISGAIAALALMLLPMTIAHPLVDQTPFLLNAAYQVRTFGPLISSGLLIAALAVLYRRWSGMRTPKRLIAGVLIVPICASIFITRRYFAEWFFSPAPGARMTSIQERADINDSDMILGVIVDGRARAYPIRYLAYHHILNDSIGSTHLVPTY